MMMTGTILSVWSHIGYPTDLNSGQRPTWLGSFRVDGTDDAAQSILHKADVFPGQSGGPVFGFWDGDVGPRAIAVQSWQNSSSNGASGSRSMRGPGRAGTQRLRLRRAGLPAVVPVRPVCR